MWNAGIEQLDTESWKITQHAVYSGGLGFGFRYPSSSPPPPLSLSTQHRVVSIAIQFSLVVTLRAQWCCG